MLCRRLIFSLCFPPLDIYSTFALPIPLSWVGVWCMVRVVCYMLYIVCCMLDCICKLYADYSLRCAACICRFVVCYLLSRTLSFNCGRACCVSLSCNIISLSTPQRVCQLRNSDQDRNEVHKLLTSIIPIRTRYQTGDGSCPLSAQHSLSLYSCSSRNFHQCDFSLRGKIHELRG